MYDSEEVEVSSIVKTAVGLIECDVITHEMIQNISGNKKEFTDILSAEGIPETICDLLFEKYVAEIAVTEAIRLKAIFF